MLLVLGSWLFETGEWGLGKISYFHTPIIDRTMTGKARILKVWSKTSLIIKAILIGFLVSTAGVLCWSVVATFVPFPWAFILMIGILVVYLAIFSGRRWFSTSKAFRRFNFRQLRLSGATWIYALLAGVLIVVIEQSGLVVTFRLLEFPAERFTSEYAFLDGVPLWIAWMVIAMISAVAGICEETGFRGYMQKPLEDRYGPVKAIGIVSLVFVAVHLRQAWSAP